MADIKQSEAEIKAAEELALNKNKIEKAKAGTKAAKDELSDAQRDLVESKGDAKAEEAAKKALEAAKLKYQEKIEAEKTSRIKAAQSGSYLPEEKERVVFHVKLDRPFFDSKSGSKISKAFIQKFTVAEWNSFIKNSSGLGYTTEIVWNPEIYNY
jgi:hypothetical protein